MSAKQAVARQRPDRRARRRSIDLEERLAARSRHALAAAYVGFLALGLLAPVAVLLALLARRAIRRAGVGEAWLGTTTVALILSFGQVVVGGPVLLAIRLSGG